MKTGIYSSVWIPAFPPEEDPPLADAGMTTADKENNSRQMDSYILNQKGIKKVKPLCEFFGECGGCQFQDIAYEDELRIKDNYLRELLSAELHIKKDAVQEIVPSPEVYHYRSRIDLKLLKTKKLGTVIGFSPQGRYRVVEIDSCPIAMPAISDRIPQIKEEAINRLPPKYRTANLVVKTSLDARVLWGGIGRRSLTLGEEDYFAIDLAGKRIFYSLDTFFQANLSILPKLIQCLYDIIPLERETSFLDLYGGVGLFGLCLASETAGVYLIEDNVASIKLAQYNAEYNKLRNFEIISGKVEDELPALFEKLSHGRKVAFVDPPRGGLSPETLNFLCDENKVDQLLYLSCNPEALMRDLQKLTENKYKIETVYPFDFFPRTRHLETLVSLVPAP